MRNLILFFRRFSNLVFFLILQVLAIVMLVKYNKSHEAAYMQWSYELTGKINRQANKVETYFNLGENNRLLAEENNILKNNQPQNFTAVDTSGRLVADSIKWDTTGKQRKYLYRIARVVNNSVSVQNNYVTLERGSSQGIQKGQAVTSAGGIVGMVTDVSDNYAIVMSLLHRNSRPTVMLKKGMISGTLTWDGRNPSLLQLVDIPKSTKLTVGDTILTSNLSINFPPGLMVGTIAKFEEEKAGNSYIIQVKPGANFFSLQFVDAIENFFGKEQAELEAKARKQ
ncbi:MAG: rod shape-determining protein MreC [Chitinophagaceae bacterium]